MAGQGGEEMIGLYEVDKELQARKVFGNPYRNKELERKRRSAILWLMNCSRVGWWLRDKRPER